MDTVAEAPPARPLVAIRASSRWAALEVGELWRFRELLLSFAGRDLKVRYKQTVLGAAWVVLQPLIGAAVFAFVFGTVARMPSDGLPYFVFAFPGMVAWTCFSQVLNNASVSLVNNANLVSKVYFPRLVLPLSAAGAALVDLAVGLAAVGLVLVYAGVALGARVLLFPVCLALLTLLALGLGLFSTALMVRYRDVRYVLPVALQFLLYASPVGYGLSALDTRVPAALHRLYLLNPLASLLEAVRWSLLGVGEFRAGYLVYAGAVAVAVFAAGAHVFKQMERRFADVI